MYRHSANVVHATGREDRTPCRTHIFLSVAHSITDHRTHLRVAQVWDVLHLLRILKVIHLDVKVCYHQERCGIEIVIESLFRDGTASWVRIVNGINKCVTETSETISFENVEHRVTGKPVAKARPRLKPAVTLSSVSIPLRASKWIDVDSERFRQDCFVVSKAMIQLLRHDQSVPREDDGAVRFDEIMEEFKANVRWFFAMAN